VNFYAYDGLIDSLDLLDAFHPQTLLAYGMNGRKLPVAHGAPLRLRVETQLGYKSVKYLQRLVITDDFVETGDSGWAWYAGI
jgi:DMSO/TMAO reductase YedYZ molybdopterin-dependent catalytic subunit